MIAACHELTIAYGSGDTEVVALDRVDMSLLENETVAVWGPSGSGKTTLLHALGGLVEPTAGVVLWRGAPLSSLDASARGRARARGIAYVFQGSNLLPAFTAYENVAFAACAAGRANRRRTARDRAPDTGRARPRRRTACRPSSPAARRSASRSPVRWPRAPSCCSATSRPGIWTPTRRPACSRWSTRSRIEFGFTLVVATHDADVAAGLGRGDRAA